MRWDALFADLEGQWEAERRRERDAEVADRTRGERAGVHLLGRLVQQRGRRLELAVRPGERLVGELSDVGADWLLLGQVVSHRDPTGPAAARQVLVRLGAVLSVDGLGRGVGDPGLARRIGMTQVLRGLGRDRATVVITDVVAGQSVGTIDGVGADFLDLAVHARDEARRPSAVRQHRTIPVSAISTVRPV